MAEHVRAAADAAALRREGAVTMADVARFAEWPEADRALARKVVGAELESAPDTESQWRRMLMEAYRRGFEDAVDAMTVELPTCDDDDAKFVADAVMRKFGEGLG